MSESKQLGRPSKYDPSMDEQAFKYCLLGATDERLAEFFEVDVATINRWKLAHPNFCASIKKGKEQADSEIAQSLFYRAKGYTAKKVVTATNQGQITDIQEVNEYVGPDTTAAIFWLKNRQPKQWRDKQEQEVTITGVKTLNDFYSDIGKE